MLIPSAWSSRHNYNIYYQMYSYPCAISHYFKLGSKLNKFYQKSISLNLYLFFLLMIVDWRLVLFELLKLLVSKDSCKQVNADRFTFQTAEENVSGCGSRVSPPSPTPRKSTESLEEQSEHTPHTLELKKQCNS